MNRATIYGSFNSELSDSYFFNAQILTWMVNDYYYSGNGKICKTEEEAISFCEGHNVPEAYRDWCVDSRDCKGKTWHIWCDERLAREIININLNPRHGINWYNFGNGDYYWSDNGSKFGVDITGNIVILYEM